MKKTVIAILLALTVLLTFTACGKPDSEPEPSETKAPTTELVIEDMPDCCHG